nr:hypothetical protein [Actinomadura syzygii]
MNQVGWFFLPMQGELITEVAHQRCQVFLGELPSRAGGDMDHLDTGSHANACGLMRGGAPGEHRDVVALGGQRQGEFTDVDVLAPRVGAADVLGERAGMLRYLGDAEREIGHAGSIAHPGLRRRGRPERIA